MDELNNIQGFGKKSKENPFVVPGDYFTEFPSLLNARIKSETTLPRKQRFLHTWKPYAAAAILLIVAIVAGNVILMDTSGDRLHAQISTMVENELYSINEETIIEAMESVANQTDASSIKPDEAIDYLLNSDLNENELLNEL